MLGTADIDHLMIPTWAALYGSETQAANDP